MKIEITGVGFHVGPQLEKRITEKLEKFQRYFGDDVLCQVKCSNDGKHLRKAEITLYIQKQIYRAERSASDIFTAVDLAVSVLEGQIRKHKTKIAKRNHDYPPMKAYLEDETLPADEVLAQGDEEILQGATFRHKSFALRPMSEEEAALQMEMLGHTFFLYLSDETGKVNLVYKRKDGNYGVIEPEYKN